jgi:hypothetical protein
MLRGQIGEEEREYKEGKEKKERDRRSGGLIEVI